ncbi:VanZ family protein [Micrococcaceae bacterium RIT802]|nr:VanZ family protein [Micrococcaceae bacterium RIT 802]
MARPAGLGFAALRTGVPLAGLLPRRQRLAYIVVPAALYLAAVLFVVFWPVPVDRPVQGSLDRALSWLHGHGVPGWFDYGAVEWLANVAMFVPWGAFGAVIVAPRRWWMVAAAALLASAAIETAQLVLISARFASGADVAANTLGAVVGVLFCAATLPLVVSSVRRRYGTRVSPSS